MTHEKLKQPTFIDSSIARDYQTCPRRAFYNHILGWKPDYPNRDLVFGDAIHKGFEVLLNDRSPAGIANAYDAFITRYRKDFTELTDLDKPKNPGRAKLAFAEWVDRWSGDKFEVLETEGYFRLKLREDLLPYVGRLDAVLQDQNDATVIMEHKTSGWRSTSLWAAQFETDIQPAGYGIAGFVTLPNFKWIIINGLFFFPKNNDFDRAIIHKQKAMMNDDLITITSWIEDFQRDWDKLINYDNESNNHMLSFKKNGKGCTSYNRLCPFHHLCMSRANPLQYLDKVPTGLKVEHWDPLAEHPINHDIDMTGGNK